MRLIQGDCLTELSTLATENCVVDCIIVDIPYFEVVSSDFDNQWNSVEDYLDWVRKNISLCYSLLKVGGNLLMFCSRQNLWKISSILDEVGYIENRTIIWARKRGFNTTRGNSLTSGYEPILFWSKGKSETFNPIKIKVDSDRKEYNTGTLKDGVNLSDVWTDISALPHNSKEKVNHPTQKPIKLMERLVTLFSNEGDTILDFTMGSGSTGVACKLLGREFIGIESNKNYYDIAKFRIDSSTKQT